MEAVRPRPKSAAPRQRAKAAAPSSSVSAAPSSSVSAAIATAAAASDAQQRRDDDDDNGDAALLDQGNVDDYLSDGEGDPAPSTAARDEQRQRDETDEQQRDAQTAQVTAIVLPPAVPDIASLAYPAVPVTLAPLTSLLATDGDEPGVGRLIPRDLTDGFVATPITTLMPVPVIEMARYPAVSAVPLAPTLVPPENVSAPPMLDAVDAAPRALAVTMTPEEADEYVRGLVGPLDDALMDQLFDREALRTAEQFVTRHNVAIVADSHFHKLVREYNGAFNLVGEIKNTVSAAEVRANAAEDATWHVKNHQIVQEQDCACGNKVRYTIKYDEAMRDDIQLTVLSDALTELRDQFHVELSLHSYEMKSARLNVQNYLDLFFSRIGGVETAALPAPAGSSASVQAASRLRGGRATADQIATMIHFLAVLFNYEQVGKTRAEKASSAVATQADALNQEDSNSSTFVNDMRTWAGYVVSALLRFGDDASHRHILLFMLSCPGIAEWGSNFVHFSAGDGEDDWDEASIDHFFVMVKLLFVKQLCPELSDGMTSALSDGEWTVLSESSQAPRAVAGQARQSTPETMKMLGEHDYIAILEQYPFPQFCKFLVRNMVTSGRTDDAALFQLFAVTKRFIEVLAQAFVAFPASGYSHLRRRIAQVICQLLLIVASSWDPVHEGDDGPHFTPDQLRQRRTYRPGALSSLQAELDALVIRATLVILMSPAGGIWSLLPSVPFRVVSADCAWRILHIVLNPHTVDGHKIPLRRWEEMVSSAYKPSGGLHFSWRGSAAASQDAAFLLTALGQLGVSRAVRAQLATGLPTERHLTLEDTAGRAFIGAVTREIFHAAFVNADTREALKRDGRDTLQALCGAFPSLLSFILQLVDQHLVVLGKMAGYLLLELPLEMWAISEVEFETLRRWLLDADMNKPVKQLAQSVFERLPWGYGREDGATCSPIAKGALSIDAHYHRRMALLLVEHNTSYQTWASKTGQSAAKKRAAEVDEYCRKLLAKLCLDCGVGAGDTFSFVAYESPLAPLDYSTDPLLAIARDNAGQAVAAYTLLAVSTCGYLDGMSAECDACLNTLLETRYLEGLLSLVAWRLPALVFRAPSLSSLPSVVKIARHVLQLDGNIASDLWNALMGDVSRVDALVAIFAEHLHMAAQLDRLQFEHEDIVTATLLQFWTRVILAAGGDDWYRITTCVTAMNALARGAILLQREQVVKDLLQQQYIAFTARMREQWQRSKTSVFGRVASLVVRDTGPATSMLIGSVPPSPDSADGSSSTGSGGGTRPAPPTPTAATAALASRVMNTAANLLSGELGVEHSATWFAYMQLWTETVAERDLRETIGASLVLYPTLSPSELMKREPRFATEKPLERFCIYRWAQHCLALSPRHPLAPMYWQVCLALIYAKTHVSASSVNPYYGFRFLSTNENLRSELKAKLTMNASAQRQLAAQALAEADRRSSPAGPDEPAYSSTLHMNLERFYSAAALWLGEPRLHTRDFHVETLSHEYDPPRLSRLLSSNVFDEPDAFWTDLVDLDAVSSWLAVRPSAYLDQLRRRQAALQALAARRPGGRANRPALTVSNAIAPVPFEYRPPAVVPISTDGIDDVQDGTLFDKQITIFVGEASVHKQRRTVHASLDNQRVQSLAQLYTNEPRERQVSLACDQHLSRSVCRGPARFMFQYRERKKMAAMALGLDQARLNTRELIVTTTVAPALVIAACTVEVTIDWLIESVDLPGISPEQRQFYTTCAIAAFFRLLQCITEEVRGYTPAKHFLLRCLDKLGSKFVRANADQVYNLLRMMQADARNILLLARFFEPALVPARFIALLQEVIDSTDNAGIVFTCELIKRFDVVKWLATAPAASEPETMLRLLLSSFAVCVGMIRQPDDPRLMLQNALISLLKPMLPVCFERHVDDFVPRLVSVMLDQLISPEVVGVIFEGPVNLTLSARIMGTAVSNTNSTTSAETAAQLLRMPPSTVVAIAARLGTALSFARGQRGSLLAALAPFQGVLLPFVCSVSLGAAATFQRGHGVVPLSAYETDPASPWVGFKAFFVAILGTLPQSQPWNAETESQAIRALSIVTAVVRQLAFNDDTVYELAFQMVLSSLLTVDSSDEVARLVRSQLMGLNWTQTAVNMMTLQETERWLSARPAPVRNHCLCFALHVIAVGKWERMLVAASRPGDEAALGAEFIATLLNIAVAFLEHWRRILMQPTDRKVLLTLVSRLINEVDWQRLSAALYLRVLDHRTRGNWALIAASSPPVPAADQEEAQLLTALHQLLITATDSVVDRTGMILRMQVPEDRQRILDKLRAWTAYTASVMAAAAVGKAPAPRPLPEMLNGVMTHLDYFASALPSPEKDAIMLPMVSELLRVFNTIPQTGQLTDSLWAALVQSVSSAVLLPTVTLTGACFALHAVRDMVRLTELCFERIFALQRSPDVWHLAQSHLVLPELDASQSEFVSSCVSDSRIFTLFAYTLKKMETPTPDIKAVVTVELAQWIEQIRPPDAVGGVKMVLLIVRLADLIYDDLMLNQNASDLRPLITPFIRALVRLGEDRTSSGVFGSLGWGAASPYSPEFRWFVKSLAAFIGSRFMDPKFGYPHPDKLMDAVVSAKRTREYSKVARADATLEALNRRGSTMADLPTFARQQIGQLFPADVALWSAFATR